MGGEGETISGHLMAPGYTDWMAYRLDDIWEMVRHEDGRVNWSQYYGWRRMAQLCEEEADQLEKAVNKLVQLWPDHPGSAAEAFKSFVGGLVKSMRETGAAAAVNADALYGVTAKLLAAKAEIAALLEQRLSYIRAEQQMIEHTRAVTRLPGATIQPPPPEPDRPPDSWWEALDRRARNIMAESDAAIAIDAARFRPPKSYRPDVDRASGSLQIGGGASQDASIQFPTLDAPQPPHGEIPRHAEDHGAPPVLDGTPLPTAPSIGGHRSPFDPVADRALLSPHPGLHSEAPPRGVIIQPTQLPPGEESKPPPLRASQVTPAQGKPASGAISSVPPMISSPTVSRPNSMPGAAIAPSGRPASGYGRRRQRDPDDPWAIKEGVPALLEPRPAPSEHDPGPGVIGIDR